MSKIIEFPSNIEAEKVVLGSTHLSQESLDYVVQNLSVNDFFDHRNRIIFKIILSLYEEGSAVDILTVHGKASDDGLVGACGGASYISSIIDGIPSVINIRHYVSIVKEKSTLRKLINSSKTLQSSCISAGAKSDEIISNLEKEIFEITESSSRSDYSIIKDIAEGVILEAEERQRQGECLGGVMSGFTDVDRLTGGFKKGSLVIVAARPSVGKSSLLLNISQNAAMAGKTVAFFSIEDSKDCVAKRILCSISRVNSMDMDCGRLNRNDWREISEGKTKIDSMPIYIDDSPSTVLEIKTKARRIKKEAGSLDVIMVDYLQLMRSVDGGSSENRSRELAVYTQYLKALAKEMEIPVIVASQLNRLIESRTNSEPKLADLRESGAIEQDADMVIFLVKEKNQEDEIVDPSPYDPSVVNVFLKKNRNGPTGEAKLVFFPAYTRFENKAKD